MTCLAFAAAATPPDRQRRGASGGGIHIAPSRGMMTTKRRVLVVAPHAEVANTVVGWLTSQGHQASLVKDFVSARSEIDANPPDLLVTEVKLGEFNGLQLAIRAHVHTPTISAIVIGD